MKVRLKLNLTYPQRQTVTVREQVVVNGILDRRRATCSGEEIVINDSFGKDNIIPDVDRYRTRFDGNRIVLRPHTKCTVSECSNRYYDIAVAKVPRNCDRTLVIVLESPHEEEYLRNNVGLPIAPAQGNTGLYLCCHLDEVLHSCPSLHRCLRIGTTRVILSNPVQFQASLVSVIDSGNTDRKNKIRDAVWRAIWDTPRIRQDFMDRLKGCKPNYIINACTKSLRTDVSNFLRCHFPNCTSYEAHHPSSWNIKKYRKLLFRIKSRSKRMVLSSAPLRMHRSSRLVPGGCC